MHQRIIAAIVTVIALSPVLIACTNTATDTAPATAPPRSAPLNEPEPDNQQAPDVGTEGQLVPVSSSNAAAAGYDAATSIMTVQFQNGRLYEYYNVSPDLWERFIAAQPHPWSAVGYPELVQGGYPYREVTP